MAVMWPDVVVRAGFIVGEGVTAFALVPAIGAVAVLPCHPAAPEKHERRFRLIKLAT